MLGDSGKYTRDLYDEKEKLRETLAYRDAEVESLRTQLAKTIEGQEAWHKRYEDSFFTNQALRTTLAFTDTEIQRLKIAISEMEEQNGRVVIKNIALKAEVALARERLGPAGYRILKRCERYREALELLLEWDGDKESIVPKMALKFYARKAREALKEPEGDVE